VAHGKTRQQNKPVCKLILFQFQHFGFCSIRFSANKKARSRSKTGDAYPFRNEKVLEQKPYSLPFVPQILEIETRLKTKKTRLLTLRPKPTLFLFLSLSRRSEADFSQKDGFNEA
jgi:hypothetical protein